MIGGAFLALAAYRGPVGPGLVTGPAGAQSLGIAYRGDGRMFGPRRRPGREVAAPCWSEGRVTLVDGVLAVAVLAGLALNAAAGWWQADPLAALVIVFYALREAREIFLGGH